MLQREITSFPVYTDRKKNKKLPLFGANAGLVIDSCVGLQNTNTQSFKLCKKIECLDENENPNLINHMILESRVLFQGMDKKKKIPLWEK